MKKILLPFLLCIFYCINICAVEIKVVGTGKVPITGYDIAGVRDSQDEKLSKKSQKDKNKSEKKSDKKIKEAIEQSNKRAAQDEELAGNVRGAVIKEAQKKAVSNAINILIDRVLGANASKNPKVVEKIDEINSQSDIFIIDQDFSGEIVDNDYVAKATLTIDETSFREIISDMGVAINTQKVRQKAILVVLDEFFRTEKEEIIPTKATQTVLNRYGEFSDMAGKEEEFIQTVVEFAPKNPAVENLNYTQPALVDAFITYDIRSIDNDIFKSKFFKDKPVTADKLSNSEELANYVKFAKNQAKADYFAIGVSYITDTGINNSTGKNNATGTVFLKIYSTHDSEVIASGSFSEFASGSSADQARANVARKIGNELGKTLSKKIQDYWKKRTMYGSEYVVQFVGDLAPMERIIISKAIKSVEGVSAVNLRTTDQKKIEYVVTYSGEDELADSIFLNISETKLADKFSKYDYKISGNVITFIPNSLYK